MPVQPQLFPDPPAVAAPNARAEAEAVAEPISARMPWYALWMQRVSLLILVLFCVYMGATLTYLPWTSGWDHNLFFAAHPAFGGCMRQGVVRGLVSGLGLVDIWIGVSEAVHYRER